MCVQAFGMMRVVRLCLIYFKTGCILTCLATEVIVEISALQNVC